MEDRIWAYAESPYQHWFDGLCDGMLDAPEGIRRVPHHKMIIDDNLEAVHLFSDGYTIGFNLVTNLLDQGIINDDGAITEYE